MHDGNMESSVLFSLNELRRLETDRQEDERQAERARLEAERRARLEVERLARLEVERLAREAEVHEAQKAQARERARLDEELRRHELEQRLALEEQLTLDKSRLEAEARATVALRQSSPWPRIAAMTAALTGVVGCGVFYYTRMANAELLRERAVAEMRERQATAQLAAREESARRELAARLDALKAQLKSTEPSPATGAEPVARPNRPIQSRRHGTHKNSPKATAPKPPASSAIADTDDPLGLLD